jgi:copper oxidase (laccase) domain-containing protein
LYAVARRRLRAAGVSNISGGSFCTNTDRERFYSWRRDRDPQRMAAAIWLT